MNNNANFDYDVSDIQAEPHIILLSELISENSHEIWSLSKIKSGYQYGKERIDDGDMKCHPQLVPYSELSYSEKAYDINASLDTLKSLLKLGYKINKPK